jgi:beta-glucosidase
MRVSAPSTPPIPTDLASLPSGFIFGTSTAAYQIEGGVAEGGRGPSIWDTFSHVPGKTHRGDTGDIACDHFHRYTDDLDLMAQLDFSGYRFSLSWARLQPSGRGPLNPEGVAFYRSILEGCRARHIAPLVTLYHWDLPQPLQDEGGWPSRHVAELFGQYARLCGEAFGDVADKWITINEPWCVSFLSHEWGVQAPGLMDPALAIRAAHHTLLAHGLALQALRSVCPDASVGITNILSNVAPLTLSSDDAEAARRLDIRMNRVFLEPLYLGSYSDEVVEEFAFAGLHKGERVGGLIQPGDLELISTPTDFVGVNHYHNMQASSSLDTASWRGMTITSVEPIVGTFGWSHTPEALLAILRRVNADFSNLPIYVAENGTALNDYVDPTGEIRDYERIDYLCGYVNAIAQASGEGIAVLGYFAWSFMDNFEWAEGFDKRFGLVYVDYETQRRIPKASAYWYQQMIRQHKNNYNKAVHS